MAEYDPATGETSYPNETEDAKVAREARERAGVGVPNPVEGGETEEEAAGGKHVQRDKKAGEA